MKRVVGAAVSAGLLAGCLPSPESEWSFRCRNYQTHTVEDGETLAGFAQSVMQPESAVGQQAIPLVELVGHIASYNEIDTPELIHPGDTVAVPGICEPKPQ